uniref:Transmembrane protein n=1 Tax=Ditylenchus dipsaci TaxID=166011 RepID=A0A915DWH6_9BILA
MLREALKGSTTMEKIKRKKKKDSKTLQDGTEAKSEAAQQESKLPATVTPSPTVTPPATVPPPATVQQPQSELSKKTSKEKEQAAENAKADESEKDTSDSTNRKIILTGVDGEKNGDANEEAATASLRVGQTNLALRLPIEEVQLDSDEALQQLLCDHRQLEEENNEFEQQSGRLYDLVKSSAAKPSNEQPAVVANVGAPSSKDSSVKANAKPTAASTKTQSCVMTPVAVPQKTPVPVAALRSRTRELFTWSKGKWCQDISLNCLLSRSRTRKRNRQVLQTMRKLLACLGQCLVSVCFLGSMLVPAKVFDAGDGIFYQWVLNIAAMLSGFVVFVSQNYPPFYPLAAIGGACATASTTISLVVVTELALALAVLLSSITNCCISFATGYFGLLWTKARPPEKQWLSWVGLLMVLIGGAMISRSRTRIMTNQMMKSKRDSRKRETKRLGKKLRTPRWFQLEEITVCGFGSDGWTARRFSPIPIIASQDSPQVFGETSKQPLQYIFSYLFGGFVTSSLILVVYSIFKKNKPYVKPELVLPALSGGLLYGCGCVTMYMALDNLSQAVAGPIVAMLPGCVAALWSVFYFREIKPGRNLFLLYAAILITLAGAMAIGFSK